MFKVLELKTDALGRSLAIHLRCLAGAGTPADPNLFLNRSVGEGSIRMVSMRVPGPKDGESCGRLLYAAFQKLADHHRFEPDFPTVEAGKAAAQRFLADPSIHAFVAEDEGRLLGCVFLSIGNTVAGIGPIAVEPQTQNRGIGRLLMQSAIEHAESAGAVGVRLVQAAYNIKSLCLYTKLGFRTRSPLSLMQGPPIGLAFAGYEVGIPCEADIPACNELCRAVHGVDRDREFRDAVVSGTATIVRHLDRVTGYTTGIGFVGHAVAEDDQGLKALIGHASGFPGPGFLVPTENHDVLSWCLGHGLLLKMQMTLMTRGLYSTPSGAWLSSVLF